MTIIYPKKSDFLKRTKKQNNQLLWTTLKSDLDTPVSTLLAGDKTVEFTDDYNSDGFIFVKQDQPLPLSLLAIYPTFVISDG